MSIHNMRFSKRADLSGFSYLLVFCLLILFSPKSYAQQLTSESKRIIGELLRINGTELSQKENFEKYPLVRIKSRTYLSMIAITNDEFKASELPSGVINSTKVGKIATLKVPVDNLNIINDLRNIVYLECAERVQPEIERAVSDLRADSVHQGLGLPQSFTGKNVIIGITDWGFDYTHPMFYDTTLQQTRILASWDQFKNSGPHPSGKSYGTLHDGAAQLAAAESDTACTYYDYGTHGSHVAGIAAGGGAGIGLKGVAFESEFLFSQFYLDAGSAIDAVDWMKSYADQEGKRLVVNMSWGLHHLGPLDGTSLLSQALDAFSALGVIIVSSGGNNGDNQFHISKTFNQDSILSRIQFYNYNAHPSMWGQSISMWGEVNKSFQAGIEVRNTTSTLVKSPLYNTQLFSGYIDSFLIAAGDTIYYNLTIDSIHPLNQVPHIRLRVKNENTSLRVMLKVKADSGKVHCWNVTELSNGAGNWGMPFTTFGPGTIAGDDEYGIGTPSCSNSVISVSAHNSEVRLPSGTVVTGIRAYFASEGPTPDERVKPDISAPGVNVLSAISSYTTRNYTAIETVSFNGRTYDFDRFSGTSMSSPATTGVVALMLEANPYLSAYDIKDILRTTARQDNRTGVIPQQGSNTWGWGKVTATSAIIEALNRIDIKEEKKINSLGIYPTLASDFILIPSNEQLSSYSFRIFDSNGRFVKDGLIRESIQISDLSSGVYFIYIYGNNEVYLDRFIKE